MNILENKILQDIDKKSFLQGMAVVAAIYLLLLFYAMLSTGYSLQALESRLASEEVVITYPQDSEYHSREEEFNTATNPADHKEQLEGKLAKAPISGLFEKSEYGILPVIRPYDRMDSFDAYKKPFDENAYIDSHKNSSLKLPAVAFIVYNYGLSPKNSKTALDMLPEEVSFLLSPYSQSPDTWSKLARKKGHEIWLNIPIENGDLRFSDPGTAAILSRSTIAENKKKLYWSLSRTSGYAGIASFTDSTISKSPKMFKKIFSDALERGLGYIELNPKPRHDLLKAISFKTGEPYIGSDLWIYKAQGRDSFAQFEDIARKKGFALAVIPPYPQNIKMLRIWLSSIKERGFRLIPASAIIDVQENIQYPPETGDNNADDVKDTREDKLSNLPLHKLNREDRIEPEFH